MYKRTSSSKDLSQIDFVINLFPMNPQSVQVVSHEEWNMLTATGNIESAVHIQKAAVHQNEQGRLQPLLTRLLKTSLQENLRIWWCRRRGVVTY